jgi:hypothetical protein
MEYYKSSQPELAVLILASSPENTSIYSILIFKKQVDHLTSFALELIMSQLIPDTP